MSLHRRDLLKLAVASTASASVPASAFHGSFSPRDGAGLTNGTSLQKYQPSWNSLRQIPTPKWLREGKFGIYTHWGVYSVPAYGKNGTWYAHDIYTNPESDNRKHHEATYGPLEKFGYKDFIPMFTGANFEPNAWAELFKRAGARFAGPVAEHHDGFAMWDTKYSPWNAAKMGPKRDVVGELSKAIKSQQMKFLTAFHHAENWFYFPTWDKKYDVSDPTYAGLYGRSHDPGALPDQQFLDVWKGKVIEVIDKYGPDVLWFDFGLQLIQEWYKKDLLAYYFNKSSSEEHDVIVTYKYHNLPPGVGIDDLELGQELEMTYNEWITDTTIDSGSGWGYVKNAGFKRTDELVTGLVDRVSKNGFLLLNVGPKPDGTIPDEAKERLVGVGKWLSVNGEAIYDTTPWLIAGEGPTKLEKAGAFNEKNGIAYTPEDIRFTAKDNTLYATVLAWPGEAASVKSLVPKGSTWAGLYPSEIVSITMLGDGTELSWKFTKEALVIQAPRSKPCDHAYVFKIIRKKPF
jgi:alpha-L-fucosidase